MRVVVLFRGFTFGGVERYVSAVTGGLSHRRVPWEVWHPNDQFASQVVRGGIDGTGIGTVTNLDVTRGGRNCVSHFLTARRAFSQLTGPFSVLLNESSPGLFAAAALAARLAGARRIVNVSHWVTPEETNRWQGGQLGLWKWRTSAAMRSLAMTVSAWVAPIEAARRSLVRYFGVPAAKARVISHGVTIPPEQSSGSDCGAELVFCGRLSREKGLDVLLVALSLLDCDVPWRLSVAGDGPERASLERMAEELGLARHVRWLGFQSHPERVLSGADLCIVPSRSESVGLSLLEGMAHGLACIASRVGGMSQLLQDGVDGLYVSPDDPAELARALRRVVRDQSLRRRLGQAARRKAVGEYSQERMVEQTVNLLL